LIFREEKMSIIDNLFYRFGFVNERQFNAKLTEAVKAEIDKTLPKWLGETADAERWTVPDHSIYANQADMYRLSPILGTAVNFLGGDIGTSKLNIKRGIARY
jgi:hypothetical protein